VLAQIEPSEGFKGEIGSTRQVALGQHGLGGPEACCQDTAAQVDSHH